MPSRVNAKPYQLFMLGLCVYVLISLAMSTFVDLDEATKSILDSADNAICLIFLTDFIYSLIRAEHKLKYLLTWGWIDLASSIPMVDALRWGRAARVLRILRVLRGVRSTRILTGFVLERRAESTFLAAALLSILFLVFSSVSILQLERGPTGNITTPEDALWWSFVTMTTVGYGDKYPVTTEGRMLAAILMTAGVGLFGTFTGFIASWFLASGEQAQENALEMIRVELRCLREQLEAANEKHSA